MNTVTRRRFLHSSLWAGTGLALGTASAAAIEPIRRSGPPHLRLSIAAYSFRQSLVDYQHKAKAGKTKPAMTLDDFIDLAAGLDLDADELREQIDAVKRWIEHSARLGAKTMRIFAGTVAKNDSEDKARSRCIAA